MKRIKKLFNKKEQKKNKKSTRITNDTIAEHREKILAGGRRYKYPLQYAKKHLVTVASTLAVVALLFFGTFTWWQLYQNYTYNKFFYNITKILYLPVGSVDGEYVKFSDYLLNYRSSVHYLSEIEQIKLSSQDGQSQLEYQRREAMSIAVADAYARKKAKEMDISVNTEDVDARIDEARTAENGTLSEQAMEASWERTFGLGVGEMRTLIKNYLLREKVSYAYETTALINADRVDELLKKEDNFESLAKTLKDEGVAITYAKSGYVNYNSNYAGLDVNLLKDMKAGEISQRIVGSGKDKIYYVKVLNVSKTSVNFSYIAIDINDFNLKVQELYDEGKVSEYIKVENYNQ